MYLSICLAFSNYLPQCAYRRDLLLFWSEPVIFGYAWILAGTAWGHSSGYIVKLTLSDQLMAFDACFARLREEVDAKFKEQGFCQR